MKKYFIGIAIVGVIIFMAVAFSSEKSVDKSDWVKDLNYLAEKLPESHIDLYANISEEEFQRQVSELKREIPELNRNEFVVELARLVASVGDAHTTLGYQPTTAYPFTFHWFEDCIYNIMTTKKYQKTLNCRLVKINDIQVEDVISSLEKIISHENDALLMSKIPSYLVFNEILMGLGIVEEGEEANYTFVDSEGAEFTTEVKPLNFRSNIEFIRETNYSAKYVQNKDQFYWYEYLPDKKALYFKYNRCRNNPDRPIGDFSDEMLTLIKEKPVDKLVIDLRANPGGNSSYLNYFINKIANNEEINQKGKIFVLVDRKTFSSALLNTLKLKNRTKALIIGEPTGGKPNHFGETKSFNLPNTRLSVYYSTKYFKKVEGDPTTLEPDKIVRLSFNDYKSNRDPVLETILDDF